MLSSELPNYCSLSGYQLERTTQAGRQHTQIHKVVLFKMITRSSADTIDKMLFSWKNKCLSLLLLCSPYLHGHGAAEYIKAMKKKILEVSSPIGQRKKTTIPTSHSCSVECWDCSSDCRISINLEMQLDTGASDREGETLSRSITSLACQLQAVWLIYIKPPPCCHSVSLI